MEHSVTELSNHEIEQVGGAIAPLLAWGIVTLYSSSTITASGLATALGIGAGVGAIVGGTAAILSE